MSEFTGPPNSDEATGHALERRWRAVDGYLEYWGDRTEDALTMSLQAFKVAAKLGDDVQVLSCQQAPRDWTLYNVSASTVFGRDNVVYLTGSVLGRDFLQAQGYSASEQHLLTHQPEQPVDLVFGFDAAPSLRNTRRLERVLKQTLGASGLALMNNATGWACAFMKTRMMEFKACLFPSYTDSNSLWAPPEAIPLSAWLPEEEMTPVDILNFPKRAREIIMRHDPLWFAHNADPNWTPPLSDLYEDREFFKQVGQYPDALYLFQRVE